MKVVWESEPGAAEMIDSILENPDICARKDCKVVLTGKQRFCSDKCRKARSRTDNSDKPNSDTKVGQALDLDNAPSLAHYKANPSMYITRLEPEKLNWGTWMDSGQLASAGFKANRVFIPGDWDYVE